MDVGLEILNARNIDLRFEKFPDMARDGLIEAITRSTSQMEDLVRMAAPKLTGKLAASVASRVVSSPNRITGIVGVTGDYGKAGALEYGSHKTITVHAGKMGAALSAPSRAVAASYQRTLNIAPQEFLRGPEKEIAADAFAAMEQAVSRAVRE